MSSPQVQSGRAAAVLLVLGRRDEHTRAYAVLVLQVYARTLFSLVTISRDVFLCTVSVLSAEGSACRQGSVW